MSTPHMSRDLISVAVGGRIDRDDKCALCGHGMIFRVDSFERPTSMFCGNLNGCSQALYEFPVSK